MPDMMCFFPHNRSQALAIQYVQLHMLPTMTPEDIANLYLDAEHKIANELEKLDPKPQRQPRQSLL